MVNIDLKEKQYDSFAGDFKDVDEQFPDVTRPFIYKMIDNSLFLGSKLLDLGCGYGRDLVYFQGLGCEVYGVDISSEMIKLAKERAPKAFLSIGSFEKLPYPDNHFDFVFSRYAIQHSHKTEEVFREIHRILKKNGVLVFLVTHPIRHYFEKKVKDYWAVEDISSVILNGKLTVEEPSHIFSEYFSPFLLSHFNLEEFHEKHDPAAKNFEGFGRYPRILLMRYKKK